MKPTTEDCIKWLERLVGFDTTSRNSNLALIEHVKSVLEPLGYDVRLTHNTEGTKANLWATIGPRDTGGIVLSGHTDVVPVDGQDWGTDPFVLTEQNGKLFGRGSADMKGFIACIMAHAERMAATHLKMPLHFAFSYDEEVGCTGVLGLVEDMRANLPAPQAVIVGEPTMMQLVGGHKGGHSYETIVHGIDGHSSRPELGANAIVAAAKIIAFLDGLHGRLRDAADPANGFTPPNTTVDIGLIDGGAAHNIIPARCAFTWGFRTVPGDNGAALAQEVFDFVEREIEPDLKAVGDRMGVKAWVEHVPRHDLPTFVPDETSPAEAIIRHLTGLNHSMRVSYGTEASHFQQAGVPGVIFGPGDIAQAHLPDEFIAIDQLAQCNAFLADLTDWAAANERIQ